VAKADSTPYPAKDLSLNSPFQRIGRAWREVASPSEEAAGDFLQHQKGALINKRDGDPYSGSPPAGGGSYCSLPRGEIRLIDAGSPSPPPAPVGRLCQALFVFSTASRTLGFSD